MTYDDLENKKVPVTGASSGIGAAPRSSKTRTSGILL